MSEEGRHKNRKFLTEDSREMLEVRDWLNASGGLVFAVIVAFIGLWALFGFVFG